MSYTIRPSNQDLNKIKDMVDRAVSSYLHSVSVENFEVLISWQDFDRGTSVIDTGEDKISLAVNKDISKIEYEELEDSVLTALLELEFLNYSEHSLEFKWQEVLKFAYVKMRKSELTDFEPVTDHELEEYWSGVIEQLSKDISEYDEFFYTNTGSIGEAFADYLKDDYSAEEVTKLRMSDVKKAGKQVFN